MIPRHKKLILKVIMKVFPEYFNKLAYRTYKTEIGLTGHVSDIDRMIAEEKKLKPLNIFEKWLLKEFIAQEKKRLQKSFQMILREYGIY